jgi:hypothetical protein
MVRLKDIWIDFNFSKEISKTIMIKGGVTDLLNQDNYILQNGNQDNSFDKGSDQIIQSYVPGRVISLGIIISPFSK